MASMKEIEEQLKECGTKLQRDPPSSVDELLKLLAKLEQLLTVVDQAPSHSMQDALLSPMMGLISSGILRHSDMDVKVSVASCISEITRITAPDPPYNDQEMKEVFELTVATFKNLLHPSGRYYKRVVSILDTVASVKSCLMMLDLELDDFIIQMFKQFLQSIGSSHSRTVFSAMETIMTDIIDESDDISSGLLTSLLESVKKDKQNSLSSNLGEKVITKCAAKLKPYVMQAVKSSEISLDDYAHIVTYICRNRLDMPKQSDANNSQDRLLELVVDDSCARERALAVGGASNSLVNPGGACTDSNNATMDEISLKKLELSSTKHVEVPEIQGHMESNNAKAKEGAKSKTQPKSVSKKRGRKPNFKKYPEEGYDQSVISAERKTSKKPKNRKSHDMGPMCLVLGLPAVKARTTDNLDFPSENSQKVGISLPPNQPISPGSQRKRGRPKKTESMMNQGFDPDSASPSGKYALDAKVKDEAPEYVDTSSRKEFKNRSDLKAKAFRKNNESGHTSKTGEEEALAQGPVASDKGTGESSGPKRKLLQKSSVKDSEKSTDIITLVEDHTVRSDDKKLISKTKGRPKSTPKETPCALGKEKAAIIGDLDDRLVGRRIKVWWPLDKTYYEGVVGSFDPKKKKHKILYTDGEEENLNLYKQRWKFIGDNVLLAEETSIQVPNASSDSVPERKRKRKSTEQDKSNKSSRRSEVSTRAAEVEGSNFGDKTLTESGIDNPKTDGLKDGTSKRNKKRKKERKARSFGDKTLVDSRIDSSKIDNSKAEISKGGEKLRTGGTARSSGDKTSVLLAINIHKTDDSNDKTSQKGEKLKDNGGGRSSGDETLVEAGIDIPKPDDLNNEKSQKEEKLKGDGEGRSSGDENLVEGGTDIPRTKGPGDETSQNDEKLKDDGEGSSGDQTLVEAGSDIPKTNDSKDKTSQNDEKLKDDGEGRSSGDQTLVEAGTDIPKTDDSKDETSQNDEKLKDDGEGRGSGDQSSVEAGTDIPKTDDSENETSQKDEKLRDDGEGGSSGDKTLVEAGTDIPKTNGSKDEASQKDEKLKDDGEARSYGDETSVQAGTDMSKTDEPKNVSPKRYEKLEDGVKSPGNRDEKPDNS